MPILLPNGGVFRSTAKTREPWSVADMKRITELEAFARAKGLQLIVLCERCALERGGPEAMVQGDNRRDASEFHLTCACTDRVCHPHAH